MVYPKPLHPGDTVRLIGVASRIAGEDLPGEVRKRAEMLEALGFKVKVDASCYRKYGYLCGTDEERAQALMDAFNDDGADGVWCIRGGYGCLRLLPWMDWQVIRANPKAFVGYSDISTLHMAMNQRCQLATFHGPMPGNLPEAPWAKQSLLTALAGEAEEMLNPADLPPLEVLHPGVGTGEITGGNLSLVTASLGTPDEIDTKGKLLFLEDVGEQVYALDRYLHELKQAGKFEDCTGVILGQFTRCPAENDGFTLHEVLRDVFADVQKPIVNGLWAGHVDNSLTVPLGRKYCIDTCTGNVHRCE